MTVFDTKKCNVPSLQPIGDIPLPGDVLPSPGPIDTCTDLPINLDFPLVPIVPTPPPLPPDQPPGNRFLDDRGEWRVPGGFTGGNINIDDREISYNNGNVNFNSGSNTFYGNINFTVPPGVSTPGNITFGPFVDIVFNSNTLIRYFSRVVYDIDAHLRFDVDLDLNVNLRFPCIVAPTKFPQLTSKLLGSYDDTYAPIGSLAFIPSFNPTAKEGVYVQTAGLGCFLEGNSWCRLTCAGKDEDIDGGWTFKSPGMNIPKIVIPPAPEPEIPTDGSIRPKPSPGICIYKDPYEYCHPMCPQIETPVSGGAIDECKPFTIVYYTLDEASGTRGDSSGNDHDLIVAQGSVGSASGKVGGAAQFIDSISSQPVLRTNDTAFGADNTNFSDVSLSVWVRINEDVPSSTESDLVGTVVFKDGYIGLSWFLSSAGDFRFQFSLGGLDNIDSENLFSSYAKGLWWHVIGMWNSTTNELSIRINNGSTTSGTSVTGQGDHHSNYLFVGHYAVGDPNGWDQDIDELIIIEKVLNSSQQDALWNGGSGKPALGGGGSGGALPGETLTLDLRLDESAGSTRLDSSGNGINFVESNGTVTSTTGIIGSAAEFVVASPSITLKDVISGNWGTTDPSTPVMFSGWFYIEERPTFSETANFIIFEKFSASSSRYIDVIAAFDTDTNVNDLISFSCGSGSSAVYSLTISPGTWYHVLGWYDPSAGLVYLRVNNATAVSATSSGVDPGHQGAASTVGLWVVDSLSGKGRVDEIIIMEKVPTPAQQDALYNNGQGQRASGSGSAATPCRGLPEYSPREVENIKGSMLLLSSLSL